MKNLGRNASILMGVSLSALAAPQAFAQTGTTLSSGEAAQATPTAPAPGSTAPATDATEAPAGNQGIGDIVVTARRRSESLQTVPVAVTAVTSAELQQRSTRDIVDIAAIAPNLQIGQGTRGGSVASINMRGQENTGQAITNDPAVGIYFDEVYLGRSAGSLLASLQDMASVQVLRGPQGTLFGRNNTGGAILLTPNRPELDEIHGSAIVNYGSYDHVDFGGVINLPIVSGKLGIRASYLGTRQDGIGRSLTTGVDDYGNRHRDGGRIAVRWRPSDVVTFDLTYDKTRIREAGPMTAPLGLTPATVNLPIGLGFYETRAGAIPLSNADVSGFTFRSEIAVTDDMAMKVIVGRRRLRTLQDSDIDNGPGGTLATPTQGTDTRQFARQNQWTAEVQLSGTALRNASDWLSGVSYTLGGFYFDERGSDGSQVPPGSVPLLSGRTTNNFAQNRSAAAYLQLEANVYDKLFLTGGTRYTKDNRALTIQSTANGVCALRALPAGTPPTICFQSADASFDYFSFTAGIRYQLSRQANLYVKYDKGQRAGGLDDSPTTIDPFQPEVVNSFEAGAKLDLFDRRVRLNIAAFSAKIDNLQRSTLLLDAATRNPYASVFNVAKATTRGIELEATVAPVQGLSLGGSLGYIDAFYNRFADLRPSSPAVIVNGRLLQDAVVNGSDLTGLKFPNTPKVTWSLTGSYEAPIAGVGDLLLRADYSHRTRIQFDVFNNPYTVQKAYGVLNGRIQLTLDQAIAGTKVSLAVYGRNITNTNFSNYASTAAGGIIIRNDQRRQFGGEVRVAF